MKIFPTVVRKIIQIVTGGGTGGEVTANRDLIERLETHPAPIVQDAMRLSVDETSPAPVDESLVILTVVADEMQVVPTVQDALRFSALNEMHPAQTESMSALRLSQDEVHPVPSDQYATIFSSINEVHPAPLPTETMSSLWIENAAHPDATESQDAIRFSADDIHPAPADNERTIRFSRDEVHPDPVEVASITLNLSAEDVHDVPTHDSTIRFAQDDTHAAPNEAEAEVELWMNILPNSVVASTNWDTPANAIDTSHTTAATITNTAGLSAKSGDLTLAFRDITADDLTIVSVALTFIGKVVGALATAATMAYQYRFGTSGAFTTLESFSDTVTTTDVDHTTYFRTYDLTTAVAGNWANIRALQANINGSQPALGLTGATSVMAVYLLVHARKEYGAAPTLVAVPNSNFESPVTNVNGGLPTNWTNEVGGWTVQIPGSGSQWPQFTGRQHVLSGASDSTTRTRMALATVGAVGDVLRLRWRQAAQAAASTTQAGMALRFMDAALAEISRVESTLIHPSAINKYDARQIVAEIPINTAHVDLLLRTGTISGNISRIEDIRLHNLGP